MSKPSDYVKMTSVASVVECSLKFSQLSVTNVHVSNVYGPTHTIFNFIVFLEKDIYQKDNDLFGFFPYILMNFHRFLQIITDFHKLQKLSKKIKILTSKNLLKIAFLKKIKNWTLKNLLKNTFSKKQKF